jgi:hypothetical protein
MAPRSCCCLARLGYVRWCEAKPFAPPRDPLQYVRQSRLQLER